MKLQFGAASEEDRPRVEMFLRRIFEPREDAPFIQPAQMFWKYYEPRTDWSGPRSYTFVTPNADIAAHAGAWPFSLHIGAGAVLKVVHPIDWAADATIPGAGALMLREMRSLQDVSCCIGGTDAAQKIIAGSGYKPAANMRFFVRPLRPWKQAVTDSRRDFKAPARFIRNTVHVIRFASKTPASWTAEHIEPENLPDAALPVVRPHSVVAARTAELFRFMLKCPTARYQLFLVRQGGQPRGYFFLSFVPGQARIADFWIDDGGSPQDWRVLAQLAIDCARADGSAAEIAACASTPTASEGLIACGFRHYLTLPIMLFDPRKYLAGVTEYHLQMLENDMSFLHSNQIAYMM